MFGLIDCNNFYASCERVFKPNLNNRAVVVLSNNDGCVIARSNESKSLGIEMGVPYYQIKEQIKSHDIAVFSSNYTLYGDMSSRVMSIVAENSPEIEIYSIDEAFINFIGIRDLQNTGTTIVNKVCKGTGIPVSLGIAPTKTLAKVANKFAKKYAGYNRVCVIDTAEKRDKALRLFDISDVWGIGRNHSKRLKTLGVKTAYDFTELPMEWVRDKMTVTGVRTWRELRGEACIEMDMMTSPKKQICTSRAFGETVTEFDALAEAISTYAAVCAEKLRKQRSCAVSLLVFIQTNAFREDLPQYFRNGTAMLDVASASTIDIVHYARAILKQIYRPGFYYKKAGVIITEIIPDRAIQQNIFAPAINREKHQKLMHVVDKLNNGFVKNQIALAAQGLRSKGDWQLRRKLLSPSYSTQLKDIIQIKCKE